MRFRGRTQQQAPQPENVDAILSDARDAWAVGSGADTARSARLALQRPVSLLDQGHAELLLALVAEGDGDTHAADALLAGVLKRVRYVDAGRALKTRQAVVAGRADHARAERLLSQLLQGLTEHQEHRRLLRWSEQHTAHGDPAGAIWLLGLAEAQAETLGDPGLFARTILFYGLGNLRRGQFQAALHAFTQAAGGGLLSAEDRMVALLGCVDVLTARDEFDRAEQTVLQATDGDSPRVSVQRASAMSTLKLAQRDPAAALLWCDQVASEGPSGRAGTILALNGAAALLALGELDAAAGRAADAAAMAQDTQCVVDLAHVRLVQGEVAADAGDVVAAHQYLRCAQPVLEVGAFPIPTASALLLEATLEQDDVRAEAVYGRAASALAGSDCGPGPELSPRRWCKSGPSWR